MLDSRSIRALCKINTVYIIRRAHLIFEQTSRRGLTYDTCLSEAIRPNRLARENNSRRPVCYVYDGAVTTGQSFSLDSPTTLKRMHFVKQIFPRFSSRIPRARACVSVCVFVCMCTCVRLVRTSRVGQIDLPLEPLLVGKRRKGICESSLFRDARVLYAPRCDTRVSARRQIIFNSPYTRINQFTLRNIPETGNGNKKSI